MTPQERETAQWKARLHISATKGARTAEDETPEYCALSNGKQCHATKEAALRHITSIANSGERRGNKISAYRCSWADHYHIGHRR